MPRIKKGTVISDACDKTITIEVRTYKSHPKYQKRYLVTDKFRAHDEKNEAKIGDTVIITEARPTSKTKTWTLTEIVK